MRDYRTKQLNKMDLTVAKELRLVIGVKSIFPYFPHLKTLSQFGLTIQELSKKLRGRVRLLSKFVNLAFRNCSIEEEQESLWAFSQRISDEITQEYFQLKAN